MSDEKRYDVIFEGHLVEGADPGVVRDNVAALFKTVPGKLDRLFSGRRYTIKSGVDETTARKYQQAMRKAGALCQIQERREEADHPGGHGRFTLAPPGVVMDETAPPEAPAIDTASLSVMDPGVEMGEAGGVADGQAVPAPIQAEIAPPGAVLVESPPVEGCEINTEGLSLAERGEDLQEKRPPQAAAVPDTRHITLIPGEPAREP